MGYKKVFLAGCIFGVLLTAMLWPTSPLNIFNEVTSPIGIVIWAWLCPFDVIFFFTSKAFIVIAIAFLGNATWYGLIAMFWFFILRLIKRFGKRKFPSRGG